MCDLKRLKLFWYELLPYVDVVPCHKDIINTTGVLFDFFRESMSECCGSRKALEYDFKNERKENQIDVLNSVRSTAGSVGMPISLDAEFPHTPNEFVPVVATDGLFWVRVMEPKDDTAAFEGISTTALPVLLIVITLTGYAAVVLWLLELRTKEKYTFSKSFARGVFETYWCAFISATTIGYGDKVAKSYAGKVFVMIWILFGICVVSVFTAIISTVMTSILAPSPSSTKPFYDETIGVLNGSFDYLVLVKKSANSHPYKNTDALTDALNNGEIFDVVMDKHAYWIYRAKIHQNQSFEFRPGVQNPTNVGYMYTTNNVTLLRCLKDYAMHHQVQVTLRLESLVSEAVSAQPPNWNPEESDLFFGPYTYSFLLGMIGLLIGICVVGGIADYFLYTRKIKKKKLEQKTTVPDKCLELNGKSSHSDSISEPDTHDDNERTDE